MLQKIELKRASKNGASQTELEELDENDDDSGSVISPRDMNLLPKNSSNESINIK